MEYIAQQRAFFLSVAILLVGGVCRLVSALFVVQDKRNVDMKMEKNTEYNMAEVHDNVGMDNDD